MAEKKWDFMDSEAPPEELELPSSKRKPAKVKKNKKEPIKVVRPEKRILSVASFRLDSVHTKGLEKVSSERKLNDLPNATKQAILSEMFNAWFENNGYREFMIPLNN